MEDAECVEFLQWALPRLRLRWRGFRRVRRQVCRRLAARLQELGLTDLAAYRSYLDSHPGEWAALGLLSRATISRFYRDRHLFEALEEDVLPTLARAAAGEGRKTLRAWSAGCASGEEPYSLAIAWRFGVAPSFPSLELRILATDVDEAVLERARRARYEAATVREVPPERLREAFTEEDGAFSLRPELIRDVSFARHDLRAGTPGGFFDLVLCRNLAFTYYEEALQREVCDALAVCLRIGGALVVGAHEALPAAAGSFEPWSRGIYRRVRRDA